MPKFLVIGEALVDVLPDGELPGGSPANTAVALARLGHPTSLVTTLGDDPRGATIREWLAASDVKVEVSPLATGRTSSATVSLAADGVPTYEFDLTWDPPAELIAGALTDIESLGNHEAQDAFACGCPAALDAVGSNALAAQGAPDDAYLHVGSIATVLEPGASTIRQAVRDAKARGMVVSFDPNARPSITPDVNTVLGQVEALVAAADIVKVSDEDLAWYYPGAAPAVVARQWARRGPALVVVTLGSAGALAVRGSDPLQLISVPGVPVPVADTVGAGDTFMGALLDWLAGHHCIVLRELTADQVGAALKWATRAAAITVSRPGMDPPSVAELAAAVAE